MNGPVSFLTVAIVVAVLVIRTAVAELRDPEAHEPSGPSSRTPELSPQER